MGRSPLTLPETAKRGRAISSSLRSRRSKPGPQCVLHVYCAANGAREANATRIIESARCGECDAGRLRDLSDHGRPAPCHRIRVARRYRTIPSLCPLPVPRRGNCYASHCRSSELSRSAQTRGRIVVKSTKAPARHSIITPVAAPGLIRRAVNSRHWIVPTVQVSLWKNGWNHSCPGRLAS
jgi:hypothetical protein